MHLCRARLSPEECLRRLSSKSCLCCRTSGHYISTCPVKSPGSSVGTSTLEGHTGSLPAPITHTSLHPILLWGDQFKSLRCSWTLGLARALWIPCSDTRVVSPHNSSPFPWAPEHWTDALLSGSLAVRFLSTCECQGITVRFLFIESPHAPVVLGL